ncbi:uncharacterized protein G2W53_033225 [Senna tora]|uniref:Uncharacterized protein n=1 Tax=Senna tora TaxID=362788 RepID=A0A834T975_9FABA|nr:uncharacterized protein G2W53_033225 [Senna tora]
MDVGGSMMESNHMYIGLSKCHLEGMVKMGLV